MLSVVCLCTRQPAILLLCKEQCFCCLQSGPSWAATNSSRHQDGQRSTWHVFRSLLRRGSVCENDNRIALQANASLPDLASESHEVIGYSEVFLASTSLWVFHHCVPPIFQSKQCYVTLYCHEHAVFVRYSCSMETMLHQLGLKLLHFFRLIYAVRQIGLGSLRMDCD